MLDESRLALEDPQAAGAPKRGRATAPVKGAADHGTERRLGRQRQRAGYRGERRSAYRGESPHSAANAKPKVKYVIHGGASALASDPLDGRTVLARHYRAQLAALLVHVGEDALTHPRRELVDQGARFALLVRLAWAQVLRDGVIAEGRMTAAFEAFVKASREHREVLAILGLERRERPAPSLDAYLRGEAESPKSLTEVGERGFTGDSPDQRQQHSEPGGPDAPGEGGDARRRPDGAPRSRVGDAGDGVDADNTEGARVEPAPSGEAAAADSGAGGHFANMRDDLPLQRS
jgi:hypothetical protein